MSRQRKSKGFTLIELMVAMAIIAVLTGLGIVGINAVLTSSRDSARRAAVQDLSLMVTKYLTDNGSVPAYANVAKAAGGINVGDATHFVKLSGAAVTYAAGTNTLTSDSGHTAYCYVVNAAAGGADAYSLSAMLEGGSQSDATNTTCTMAAGSVIK